MIKVKYKGYQVSQAKNNHVAIAKDNEMIFHANCRKKLSEDELKNLVDWYINIFKNDILEKVEG